MVGKHFFGNKPPQVVPKEAMLFTKQSSIDHCQLEYLKCRACQNDQAGATFWALQPYELDRKGERLLNQLPLSPLDRNHDPAAFIEPVMVGRGEVIDAVSADQALHALKRIP